MAPPASRDLDPASRDRTNRWFRSVAPLAPRDSVPASALPTWGRTTHPPLRNFSLLYVRPASNEAIIFLPAGLLYHRSRCIASERVLQHQGSSHLLYTPLFVSPLREGRIICCGMTLGSAPFSRPLRVAVPSHPFMGPTHPLLPEEGNEGWWYTEMRLDIGSNFLVNLRFPPLLCLTHEGTNHSPTSPKHAPQSTEDSVSKQLNC